MSKKLKFFITIFLFVISCWAIINLVEAQQESAPLSVSATVQTWLNFDVSTTTLPLSPDLIDLAGNLNIASSTVVSVFVGTNHNTGWSLSISSTSTNCPGSKLVSGQNYIGMSTPTSTVTTGQDAYGLNATSTLSGVQVGSYYNFWESSPIVVGEICSTGQTLAFSNQPHPLQEALKIKFYASCDKDQPSGTYTDTVVLTLTPGT